MIKSVCVFCASSRGAPAAYLELAKTFGALLVDDGKRIIYGGGSEGLMGALAEGALEAGGHVVGVVPHFMKQFEDVHTNLPEMHHTDTMHERKQKMFELSDAFVALPGACGTLDEWVEILTWKRLLLHNKPTVLLNHDGFYDSLLAFFDRMIGTQFVGADFAGLYAAFDKPADVLSYLNNHVSHPPQKVEWEKA